MDAICKSAEFNQNMCWFKDTATYFKDISIQEIKEGKKINNVKILQKTKVLYVLKNYRNI